uniref:Reverse transcriptase domain-containing protein n=1 Tax=Macrostomum lignano TaxID=282301 RepID=A0A1I8FGH4_9PLAT
SATPPPALASCARSLRGSPDPPHQLDSGQGEGASQAAAAGRCAQMRRSGRRAPTHEDSGRPSQPPSMPTGPPNPAPEPDRPLVRWLLDRRLATTAAQLPLRDLLEEIGDVGPDLLLKRCLAELAGPERVPSPSGRVVTRPAGLLGLLEMDAGAEESWPGPPAAAGWTPGRASVTRQVWSSSVAATAGSFASQAADSQPPTAVPFRLTPNLCELISPLGIRGPLQAAIIASARCLVLPKYQLAAYLRCVLRDEVILTLPTGKRRRLSRGRRPHPVSRQAVSAILARLQALAAFEGAFPCSAAGPRLVRTPPTVLDVFVKLSPGQRFELRSSLATSLVFWRGHMWTYRSADKTLRHLNRGSSRVTHLRAVWRRSSFRRCLARENGSSGLARLITAGRNGKTQRQPRTEVQRRHQSRISMLYCPNGTTGGSSPHGVGPSTLPAGQLHRDIQKHRPGSKKPMSTVPQTECRHRGGRAGLTGSSPEKARSFATTTDSCCVATEFSLNQPHLSLPVPGHLADLARNRAGNEDAIFIAL